MLFEERLGWLDIGGQDFKIRVLVFVVLFVGLKNNPDLRVVLLFGYNSWKSGATRFLHQIVNPLNEKSIILAGGQVESFTSLTSEK